MRSFRQIRKLLSIAAFAVLIGGVSLMGCAADRPTSTSPPPKEIKSNSDRFFDKMKQEERERGKGPEAPSR